MKVENNMNFDEVARRVKAGIGLFGDTEAKRMEAYAKENRPWIDRTGNARNSIQGKFGWRGNDATIRLSGNMPYSVWLELAYGKKYAILKPTIERHAPAILKGYKKAVSG